jgi:hypothetical protein
MTPTKASPELRPKTGYRYCDGQLEVVACGGEGEGGGLAVVGTETFAHPEAHHEHHDEV